MFATRSVAVEERHRSKYSEGRWLWIPNANAATANGSKTHRQTCDVSTDARAAIIRCPQRAVR